MYETLIHVLQTVLSRTFSLLSCSAILREPYIDRSRVGAFGKEYGGYITSLLVSTKDSPVKCAAVFSPITDFELYGELRCITRHSPRKAE